MKPGSMQLETNSTQYKNNIRSLGVAEEDHENLENKIVRLAKDEYAVDDKEEIEIAHRVGSVRNRNSTENTQSRNGNLKPKSTHGKCLVCEWKDSLQKTRKSHSERIEVLE